MAEENILLRVGIDEDQIAKSEKAIIAARTEIDRLRAANKELEKQGEKNSVRYVKNQTDIKDLSTVVRENERVLAANAKMSRSAGGSIAELRESVKALQAEYVNLSKEERENTAVGVELQKRIRAQNDELKELEKQIGITGRNVGNYREEIEGALKESGLFSSAQASIAKAQKAVSAATKVATLSTRSFGAALVATGIGAIVVLLGSLIAFLLKTQEGMDFVAKATSAVAAFVGTLLDAFANLGKQIIDNIIPAFVGLKDILVGILTLDFDQVKKGIDGVRESVSNIDGINVLELGANAARAAAQAFELEGALIKVKRAEADLNVEREKSAARIDELRERAKDETLSFEERTKALEEAVAIEEKQLEQSLDLARQRLEIIKQQNELTESTEADLQRVRDAEIEIAKLEAQSTRQRIKLGNELRGLRNQEAAEAKRIADQRRQEEEKADRERLEAERAAAAERERIQKEANENFKSQLQSQAKETDLFIRGTLNRLKEEFASGIIDFDTYQAELDRVEALALETRRAALEAQLEQTRENAEIDAETRLQIEINLQSQLRSIEDQEISAAVKRQQEKIRAEQKAAEERRKIAEELAAAQIAAEDAVLQAALNVFGQQSAAGKIAASFQAILDAFRGANLALGTVPPPFGQVIAASTLASGLANVARINSTPPPKFADGGGIEVSGPSHSAGGVPVALGGQTVAEVEGGEGLFVMKKNAFQSLKALSNYNQLYGGRSWFGGGSRMLADGGAVARTAAPGLDRSALQDAQSSFQESVRDLQIVAKISDINRVQSEVRQIEVSGDLR